MRLKEGERVKLHPGNRYIDQSGGGWGTVTNPHRGGTLLPVSIEWDNGRANVYEFTDIDIPDPYLERTKAN